MSIQQLLFATQAGLTNALEDVFNFSAFGDSSTVASVTSRAGCFGRDSNFNYENYVWIVVGDDLRKYTYSGGSWSLTSTTDSPLSTNILGCADNGTHVLLCDADGNAALYNKSTDTFGSSRSIGGGNAQGASWDGTQWIITFFESGSQDDVYRVNADNTSTLGFSSLLDNVRKRGNAYDFDLDRHWVFALGSEDETFAAWDGSSFGSAQDWDDYDSNVTTTMMSSTTVDDGDIFITTEGEKFLCQFDSGVVRVRAKLTDSTTINAYVPNGGHQIFTSTGTTSWTVPTGVTSICVLCVGGGGGGVGSNGSTGLSAGGGGGGGALYYKNSYSVTPGDTLTVVVGAGGSGGAAAANDTDRLGTDGADSSVKISSTTICLAKAGTRGLVTGTTAGSGGDTASCVGDGGGSGGNGGAAPNTNVNGAGGGAGGYAGAGGVGSSGSGTGTAGSGGAGGGGGRALNADAGGGGGVGIYGQGSNGAGGASANNDTSGGGGGSGGNDGVQLTAGTYGGGGGSRDDSNSGAGGDGGDGAVRILWGTGRAFPSTHVSSETA